MDSPIEIMMILLVLSDFALLGLSRLRTCISIVSFQGMLLGALALVTQWGALTPRLFLIAAASFLIKGFVFPILLRRGIREAGTQNEIEPFVGYITSVIAGLFMLGVSLWMAEKLPLFASGSSDSLIVPAALTTLFTGLFLIIARKNALNQCLGYIIMENGIYTFGVYSVVEIPLLVELGILLDAFVAVFVMGIAIYHINRAFDHLDADRLNVLKG
ncbi:MAG: hydrogenase [Deltaproteobacteria bacterium]|nr:hydrogenase [Deltaproteobacteria bacterium]